MTTYAELLSDYDEAQALYQEALLAVGKRATSENLENLDLARMVLTLASESLEAARPGEPEQDDTPDSDGYYIVAKRAGLLYGGATIVLVLVLTVLILAGASFLLGEFCRAGGWCL
jgi:hypothetical protein